jgi:1-acyl-sn-glycerol-3-phosphate acyltransferase
MIGGGTFGVKSLTGKLIFRSMPPRQLSQRLGLAAASAGGWKVDVPSEIPSRCVIVGAPHTSNLDLVLTLLLMLAADLRLRWVGKDTLFRGPLGLLFRGLGGIPIDRSSPQNFVEQMVAAFGSGEPLRLAIAPAGTRRNAPYWKTGFYYIALGARVPIVLGYADYRRRVVGLGPTVHPTGDLHADFESIRAFYADIVGRHPGRQGEIRMRGAD